MTANVALWPQFDVLIANPRRLASLTAQQRAWLQQAAGAAARDSVALAASGSAAYIRQACAMGARFVTATPADLAALRRSLSAVYQNLEADPQTRAFIQQIQRLKDATPPGPRAAHPRRVHPRTVSHAAGRRRAARSSRRRRRRAGSPRPGESRGPAGCPR